MVGDKRYWFEDVPEEVRYWTVARVAQEEPRSLEGASIFSERAEEVEEFIRRGFEIGFVPAAFEPQLVETNPEKSGMEIYTSRAAAEEELRVMEERDPDEYLRLVEEHGQEVMDQAYNNTPPYRVVWTTADLLLEKIKDLELELAGLEGDSPPFEYVVVDGQYLDRLSFRQELERRVQEEGTGDA